MSPIGGFNQRQGKALPPQIFFTLIKFVVWAKLQNVQTRNIRSVYSQENYRNVATYVRFKAESSPNSISAWAPRIPRYGSSQRSPRPPAEPIPALGPPGLETTCLPKYLSLNPPMMSPQCFELQTVYSKRRVTWDRHVVSVITSPIVGTWTICDICFRALALKATEQNLSPTGTVAVANKPSTAVDTRIGLVSAT